MWRQPVGELADLYRELDLNEDKELSFKEWTGMLRDIDFKRADRDDDGVVNLAEWKNFFQFIRRESSFNILGPGQPIPNISLKSLQDGVLVKLAEVKRHTVLVFGSYT